MLRFKFSPDNCANLSTVLAIALLLSSLPFSEAGDPAGIVLRGLELRGVRPLGPAGPWGARVPRAACLQQTLHHPLSLFEICLRY